MGRVLSWGGVYRLSLSHSKRPTEQAYHKRLNTVNPTVTPTSTPTSAPPVPSRARHAQYTRLVIGTTCNIWHLYRRVQARYVSVMSGSVNSRTICMPICMRQRGHFHSQGSAGTFTLKAASFTLAAPQPRARPSPEPQAMPELHAPTPKAAPGHVGDETWSAGCRRNLLSMEHI